VIELWGAAVDLQDEIRTSFTPAQTSMLGDQVPKHTLDDLGTLLMLPFHLGTN
jgi:hypothetical protein